jgi:hypothetical protein
LKTPVWPWPSTGISALFLVRIHEIGEEQLLHFELLVFSLVFFSGHETGNCTNLGRADNLGK